MPAIPEINKLIELQDNNKLHYLISNFLSTFHATIRGQVNQGILQDLWHR